MNFMILSKTLKNQNVEGISHQWQSALCIGFNVYPVPKPTSVITLKSGKKGTAPCGNSESVIISNLFYLVSDLK
jgi:hypothetical protein